MTRTLVTEYIDSMAFPFDSNVMSEDYIKQQKVNALLDFVWNKNRRFVKQQTISYYQSLLGCSIVNCRPAPKSPAKIRVNVWIPEFFYPEIESDDFEDFSRVFYAYRAKEDKANYDKPELETADTLEVWDKEYLTVIDLQTSQVIDKLPHYCDTIPVAVIQNIVLGSEVLGVSDIVDVMGLNDYLNIVLSSMVEETILRSSPPAVMIGTKLSGPDMVAARAVYNLEPGGSMNFMNMNSTVGQTMAVANMLVRAIRDVGNTTEMTRGLKVPRETLGQSTTPLLWRNTTRVTTKENLFSEGIQKINSCILSMIENIYGKDTFEIKPGLSMKGNEVGGIRENYVKFKQAPWMLSDDAKIKQEQAEKPYQAPGGAGSVPPGQGYPSPALSPLTQGTPQKPQPEMGQKPSPTMGLDLEKLRQAMSPGGSAQEVKREGVIELGELTDFLKGIKKLKGNVYVSGGIVTEGRTTRDVDVFLSHPLDKATIINALPASWKDRVEFNMIKKGVEPDSKQFLKVTSKEVVK